MYLASSLIKNVLTCGETAAKRSRSVPLASLWESLAAVDANIIAQRKEEALRANLNFAVPSNESPTKTCETTGKPLPAIGVDGSQIYPRPDRIKYGYVTAVAYTAQAKPIYASDFVDLTALWLSELDRPDLSRLCHLADDPKGFVDLWRTLLELQVGLEAVQTFPDHILFMDGPLLPPKTRETGQSFLIQHWLAWLRALKTGQGSVAGIVSGPSSSLITMMIAISQHPSVWSARQKRERVSDRDLMHYGLSVGERSAVFHYGSQRELQLREQGIGLDFFFVKPAKNEVFRVEIPDWISASPDAVEQAHASILADCRALGSYSFVLTTAHYDIKIPFQVSNDLYERAVKSFINHGGVYALSGKHRMKLAGDHRD